MINYDILESAKNYSLQYLKGLPDRRVYPNQDSLENLQKMPADLPDSAVNPEKILDTLIEYGTTNTVASNSGRYFGFVFGGTIPASLAANWVATAWDQNAVFRVSSPIAAHIEKIAGDWLLDLLSLPSSSAVGFVTGTTMANFCGLMAARYAIYQKTGWDIKVKGMSGAPPIRVVTGEEVHASMQRALFLAGFGLENIIKVPTDDQGRIIPEKFPAVDEYTLICLQAGNVNTGAIDPIIEIASLAKPKKAWIHIDGAFGLWARACASTADLATGYELADSWAVDLHKWLNVPYDSGLIICKHPKLLKDALSVSAAYLPDGTVNEPYFYTPEMSRRARCIDTWAALQSMGRKGVDALIEGCCNYAAMFAAALAKAGFNILNDVILNQVLVSFGKPDMTNRIIQKIQADGTCWCGGTVWKGQTAMRISVSSWVTTKDDIMISATRIIEIANTELANENMPV